MTECCGVGALSKLSIGPSGSSLSRMDFINFVPRFVKTLSDGSKQTIRGTLAHNSIAASEGMAFVGFRISMYMTALKNDVLFPLMGMAESPTDTFTLADALPAGKVVVTPQGGLDHTFDNVFVSKWLISGQKGSTPIRLDVDFEARSWAEATAGTYTHGSIVEGYPYSFTQGSMELEGGTRYFNQVRLGLDYGLVIEHNNSVYPTNVCPTDHDLSFGTGVLYSTCDDNTDLYSVPMTSATAATGSELTLGWSRTVGAATYSTSFVVANVKLVPRFPQIQKAAFNRLPIQGQGYAPSGTPLIVATNDASA